ncbi:MAG: hypothetical protein KAT58_06435 [candidate division Zixibacteria bacterium]|nr:hypothetical protein [candidate division Zixibacteria bacterium]
MRIDQFLQKVGVVKRRSIAKTLCDNGAVQLNGRKVKPAQAVAAEDILSVKFPTKLCTYTILQIPSGNVKKESRDQYIKLTSEEHFHEGL